MSAALESYDNQTFFETCMSSLQQKVTEMQTTERKLSENVKSIETQLKEYHNAITNAVVEQPMSASVPVASPTSISEESAAHLASSLVVEQREKEKKTTECYSA